jgi:hypothetical protein
MAERYLHSAVECELARPSTEGDRHNQILRVLPYLVGDGWNRGELFELFRSRYPLDFPDVEIRQLVDWGLSRDFEPSQGNSQRRNGIERHYTFNREFQKLRPLTPEQRAQREKEKVSTWINNAESFLRGFRAGEYDLWERSTIRPLDPIGSLDCLAADAEMVFRHLFGRGELINLCADYTLRQGKAQPCGAGLTCAAIEWCQRLSSQEAPQSAAGCWIRINPLKSRAGSGKKGAFTDGDVAAYRYHLLESDVLPLDLQLSLLSRLRLPIALILDSGGRSYHAWVASYARSPIGYQAESECLQAQLEHFGFDRGNKNPSRFSRLPGVMRTIGARKTEPPATNQVAQRIVYLNPTPKKRTAIF